jgi:hypothetical protein
MKKKRIEMWRKNGWEDDYNTNGLYIRDKMDEKTERMDIHPY